MSPPLPFPVKVASPRPDLLFCSQEASPSPGVRTFADRQPPSRSSRRLLGAVAVGAFCLAVATPALAGDFDVHGDHVKDPSAAAFIGFETDPARFVPSDVDPACVDPGFSLVKGADALDAGGFATVHVNRDKGCAERLSVTLPPSKGSYRVTAWLRHGRAGLNFVILYKGDSGLPRVSAQLGPTGRTTSDGWVEMASNPFSADGAQIENAYLKVVNFADGAGTDIDAIEVVPAGKYKPSQACAGVSDPVCGPEAVCVHGSCASGDSAVPPLPPDALRDPMVDVLAARIRIFFGGARSRKERLPQALATIESMRKATTAWQFWGQFARSIRQLSDWHTSLGLPLGGDPKYRLNACFFEGDADLSHGLWPKDSKYSDILVSHAGTGGAAGLHRGDRLVAVDGQHPLAWARSLVDVDPGFHVATDPEISADLAEALGGPWWSGALLIKYATNITVIRCDAATAKCEGKAETIEIASLVDGSGDDVVCDNRPFYHLQGDASPGQNHAVFWQFFEGPIADTTPEEAIYGVVWDNLYGGGDPNGYVNGNIKSLIAKWKSSARGVILDHRAGNGGTLDAPTLFTSFVRPAGVAATVLMPIEIAGYDGPADKLEGVALFDAFKGKVPYKVGAADHDPTLPVALITHRDGSASDYLPLGMKGAPNVRLFGPHATAGAFSTFVQVTYHGAFELQFASGDTIGPDGTAHIGHGVEPDELVQQRQSDLLAGKDSLHEAALTWLRAHLKETP